MSPVRRASWYVVLSLALLAPARAQLGDRRDRPGEVQASLVPPGSIPPAVPLSPRESLAAFKIAPGFRVELVASEPLIQAPVAVYFGEDLKLWVVEMRGYMRDFDGSSEDEPSGRIVYLTDEDGDGDYDQTTVFLDQLPLPRAVLPVAGGVLIGVPPHLLYCRDVDGDGRADSVEEIADDYGIRVDPARPELANPERAPNSLLWGMDNWIYSGAYTKKWKFENGSWQSAPDAFRGQWGLSQDDFGTLYYNSNSDHLRADIIPARYLARNPHLVLPGGRNVRIAESQLVWPDRVSPGVNRGYQPEILRNGKLKAFTAACAPWIYRGDLLPGEVYGNAFVAEPAANLVRRSVITRSDGAWRAANAYQQSEFLTSTDERFRPVNFTTGPDGALYIVDFHRGVLQHRISLTSYLRRQGEERGLLEPLDRGRIYRVVPANASRIPQPRDLSKATTEDLVACLSSTNSWHRETAQRLLVERQLTDAESALVAVVETGESAEGRLHALWTLEGLAKVTPPVLAAALHDPAPIVRVATLQILEYHARVQASWNPVLDLATREQDPHVIRQIVLTLGSAGDNATHRAALALVVRHHAIAFIADAYVSGAVGREIDGLAYLSALPQDNAGIGGVTRLLGRVLAERAAPDFIAAALDLAARCCQDGRAGFAGLLLEGLAKTKSNQTKLVEMPAEPAAIAVLRSSGDRNLQGLAQAIARRLTWPGKASPLDEATRSVEEIPDAVIAQGRSLYTTGCAACHQQNGRGLDGLAPPLAGSEWVNSSAERSIRVVLNGLSGAITVAGKTYDLDMPAMNFYSDEQIAVILSYVGREWGNRGPFVRPEDVRRIRQNEHSRNDAWTEAELRKFNKIE